MKRVAVLIIIVVIALVCFLMGNSGIHSEDRAAAARCRVLPLFMERLGRPVFIRIIKESLELELWQQQPTGAWELFRTYPIAAMSGKPGPKEKEGDKQAPEGFYRVYTHSLNPKSAYFLSFDIGYPNRYDHSLGRTGSFIMVHGGNVSVGCFAMTDPGIAEIYTLVAEALQAGQPYVPVQVYPFRMTDERMQQEATHCHADFWRHLQPGWQHTEAHHQPWPDSDN